VASLWSTHSSVTQPASPVCETSNYRLKAARARPSAEISGGSDYPVLVISAPRLHFRRAPPDASSGELARASPNCLRLPPGRPPPSSASGLP